MENTKTTELRRRKSSVKAKLMSAVAMLLVSAIMLGSSTYAWFVLSTAPEVKGMSTTVGANGSLEIALLNDETGLDATKITSGVGDSSAIQDVTEANITWGNLVDLSGDAYGLHNSKLYPAALNFAAGGSTKLANLYGMLQYPTYGLDGRVAQLNADTQAGKYDGGAFKADEKYYGVRVVGSVENANPLAFAFRQARENYVSYMSDARDEAISSLEENGSVLMNLAKAHSENRSKEFTEAEVQVIRDALAGVQSAADKLKLAIQNAYEASRLSKGEAASTNVSSLNIEEFTDMATQVNAYKTLNTDIQTAVNSIPATGSGTDGGYTWDDISEAMRALVDSDGMTMNGMTFAQLQDLMTRFREDSESLTTEERAIIQGMVNSQKADAEIGSGLYSQVADFVDDYSVSGLTINIPYSGINVDIDVTLTVHKSATLAEAYKVPMGTVVDGLESPSGNDTAIITTPYGYVIDLAFRCNADTTLTLSAATQRVAGDDVTMGNGSTFTVTQAGGVAEADMQKLAKALRVVFVKNVKDDYQILGVAGLVATDTDTPLTAAADNKYELHMYNYEVDANGGLKLTAQKMINTSEDEANPEMVPDDTITALAANEAQCISVLVYLDGNYVDYGMNGVEGALNLQFGSSTELTPMDYTGYVTGEETPAASSETTAATESTEATGGEVTP